MDPKIVEILKLITSCTEEQRRIIFHELRKEIAIHPIEEKLNTQAEIILSAINRDASGLTFRMLRGVIAEAAFETEIIPKLANWSLVTPNGDLPYDFLLSDGHMEVSIQIKLQRSKGLRPMSAMQASKKFPPNYFVVETQKTRGGVDPTTKENTRPYRFGEFDILGVCMQPSTGSWASFLYTVANWLLPQDQDPRKIQKFQPVPESVNDDWTDDFETCVSWLKSGIKKTIKY